MRIVVGVSGASGVEMSLYLLRALKAAGAEVHLIVTEGAKLTWDLEAGLPIQALYDLADHVYADSEYAAVVASGSFATEGMIVMPCSMKTLAGIVSGYAENLLLRTADVCLKEGRRLVLVPRETPLGKIHLRNLSEAAELGCSIVPPMLTFYNSPKTLEDQIHHIVGKVLLQFGVQTESFVPWKGASTK